MKNRCMRYLPFFGLVLFFCLTLFALAQGGAKSPAAKTAAPQSAKPAANANLVDANGKKFNPHDLSGIWIRPGGNRGCGRGNSNPPLTKAGGDVTTTRM